MAEKGDPKCIFTIPTAILSKPSLSDEITVTKSLLVQIMRYFKNFVFMSEKKKHITPAAFLSSFRMRPI